MKVGAQDRPGKGERLRHLKVATPADTGAGAGEHEKQQQEQSHTSWGGRAVDPADARPCGEQEFPKPEGAGLRLSLERWRGAQDKLRPLHLPVGVPTSPHPAYPGHASLPIGTHGGHKLMVCGKPRSLPYPIPRLLTEVHHVGHGVHEGEPNHHVAHKLVELDVVVQGQDLGQPCGPQPREAVPEHQHLAEQRSREPIWLAL